MLELNECIRLFVFCLSFAVVCPADFAAAAAVAAAMLSGQLYSAELLNA